MIPSKYFMISMIPQKHSTYWIEWYYLFSRHMSFLLHDLWSHARKNKGWYVYKCRHQDDEVLFQYNTTLYECQCQYYNYFPFLSFYWKNMLCKTEPLPEHNNTTGFHCSTPWLAVIDWIMKTGVDSGNAVCLLERPLYSQSAITCRGHGSLIE